MESINFKPTTKVENLYFILSFLLAILISLIGLFFSVSIGIIIFLVIIILGFLVSLIAKKIKSSYSYEINSENEIQIDYKFINKFSSTIRIDQLTSVSLHQSFLEKIAGVYTVRFGIFGKSNILGLNGKIAAHQQGFDSQELLTLEKEKAYNIFEHLLKEINGGSTQINKTEKPRVFADNFILFLLTIILLLIPLPILIISMIKTKNTTYSITQNSVVYEYDYIFGSYKTVVPFEKLTNTEVRKNIFSYLIFKIGHVSIFTGGSNDPIFFSFKKYEQFSNEIVSHTNKNISLEKPIMVEKPGSSYFSTFFFWYSLLFIFLFTGYFSFRSMLIDSYIVRTSIISTLILFYIGGLFLQYILYKNTSYEIYKNKVIDKSGIINITTKEIPLEKIKYVEVKQNLFFERILNQGTIHIYTPGSASVDNKLNSLEIHKKIYDSLVEYLEEE